MDQDQDQRHPHHGPKRVAVILGISWIVIPLVIGLVSGNALIGAVAFGVWTSMSTIAFGIWASGRAAAAIPTKPPIQSSATFTPQGWALPLGVVGLAVPPTSETEPLDRLRLFWARFALLLSSSAFIVALLLGIGSERSLGVMTAIITAYGVIVSLGVLWWTHHNLKQGSPRPILDRPASLIGNLVVFVLWVGLMFSVILVSSNHPPVQWLFGDVLAILLFIGFMIAVVMWIKATGRRWSLSYASNRDRPVTARRTAI